MASSFRPSISSFMLPSLSSCNPSQKFSLFHLGSGIRRFHDFGLKPSKFLRHDDDNCMRAKASGNTSSIAAPENALDWVKHDKRRMLHVVYRVGDLDKTIKFYTECLGMKLLRQRDMQEQRHTNAFLGYGPEDAHFAVELTYNYGIDKYDIGDGFGRFGLAVDDISRIVELVRAKGGKITREPMLVKGGNSVNAFIEDPDGYQFELLERAPSPEPLCKVMLRVCDLDRSIKFYEKAFGMELLRTQDDPESKNTIAILGYGPEEKCTVLELTYNYGVTKYDKGDAYAQIAIATDDVYKTAEAIKLAGGKITREPGPIPDIKTKITSCEDPDGWKTCYSSASTMNHGRQSSKVPFGEKELFTSSFFSFTLFTPNNHTLFSFCPMFSTIEFNELNNSNSFTPTEDSSGYCDVLEDLSYAKSDTDSCNEACGDESDEEVSLEELLQDGKTKEKVEVLAAMVGLETTDPATVLNEVVRVLKVLNKINQYQLSA
ncbi:hypothetical protein VIGAN_11250300 [Vigna angularis var. angularis]|uniref:lactoylglutathione lyase n=1 Tax=Vigna angularis var. angularis TaxID=157739 RepID=A0A0S3TCM6_PHAAN|nr:probable lactoylglutathione lyase, chloroplastic isoform X2 [Vigna angularis]BAU02907.1 hypothetical protein VIGAN_11250300 [Vigna angularis var. angularis]